MRGGGVRRARLGEGPPVRTLDGKGELSSYYNKFQVWPIRNRGGGRVVLHKGKGVD